MIKLNHGDKVAVVSLSAGTLGEVFCAHQLERGTKRLTELGLEVIFMPHALNGIAYIKDHPEKRAEDLVAAFADPTIKGIICAIGGEDTFRLAPYLLTEANKAIIKSNPKFFMGYSDTTVNHLMLTKLGVPTYYGLSFLTCFAELGDDMLAYSKAAFENIFTTDPFKYKPSPVWYEERENFSPKQIGTNRNSHSETRGYELLQGPPHFSGHLIGGCVESFYDLLVGTRYPEEKEINDRYHLFPSENESKGAVVFLETSEEQPTPERLKTMLQTLKANGLFTNIQGVLVGKPQNEAHYETYKTVWTEIVPANIPILYNVNIGHAYPKMLLQYGAKIEVNSKEQQLTVQRI